MFKTYPHLTDAKFAEARAEVANAERTRREKARAELQDNPFDPRTEVSADARRVIKHLWIIFVAFPLVLGILFVILK